MCSFVYGLASSYLPWDNVNGNEWISVWEKLMSIKLFTIEYEGGIEPRVVVFGP